MSAKTRVHRHGRGDRPAPTAPRSGASAAVPACPAFPTAHPAFLLAVLVAAAVVALSVTYDAFDPDQWQHLTVGRFIWEAHRFPTTQLWTWPTYGGKDVDYAWGFEALVWPFWKLGGVTGLYAWRWLTTLAAFALAWLAARRMGARGLVSLVVVSLCAVLYRGRSQVRPETVAAVLLAAEILLLESRRHGRGAHPAWLVFVAWAWANTHISYWLFFLVLGIHVAAAAFRRRGGAREDARLLALTGAAALAVSFLNPSGWRTLAQPFEFFFVWRHEPIYQGIDELLPVDWSVNWRNGLPLLLPGWPLLALSRHRRPGLDGVELMTCAAFSALVLFGVRFVGVYALAAAVYVSRDLDEWLRPRPLPAPLRSAAARGALAAAGCVLVALPELARPGLPIRMRVPAERLPVGACDFIGRQGLRGRIFNPFGLGGYLCFRFWPERDRLPFMGIHQEGTREIRDLYTAAFANPGAWRELDRRFRFDLLVLDRTLTRRDALLPTLDADSAWVRVFADDVAYVFVRRDGPFAALVRAHADDVIPSDPVNLQRFGERAYADSALRRRAERELWRQVRESPQHAQALGLLANIALGEDRLEDARRFSAEALRLEPGVFGMRERLGIIALLQGRPRDARRWFEEERALFGPWRGYGLRRGQAAQALGDLRGAREAYRRELERHPEDAETRDSLAAVSRRLGG